MSDENESTEALRARLTNLQARYDKLRDEHQTTQASLKGLAKERDQYKAAATSAESLTATVEKLRADLEASQGTANADLAMADAGIKDRSVREFLRFQYDKHKGEAGEKAQEFDAWFGAQVESPSPVIAAVLPRADAAPAPAEAAPEAPVAPVNGHRTEAGVKPAPAPPSPYSPGSIASMSREEWNAQKAEILKGVGPLF